MAFYFIFKKKGENSDINIENDIFAIQMLNYNG